MNSYRFGLSMVAVLVATGSIAVGCGDDDTSATTTTGTTTTTSASTSSAGGGTSNSTTTTTTSGGGEGGAGQGGAGQGGAGQGGSGQGGGGDVCAPAPGDDACVTCTKTNCCDEVTACSANAACQACLECLQMGNPLACLGGNPALCSFDDPEQGALLSCGQDNCLDMCQ
jgi:hypothetical protein